MIKRIIGAGVGVVIGLLALSTIFGSWYTIDEGERGVILRNGAITGTAEPGLGFKLPFVDEVVKISVRNGSRQYPQVAAYSKDQQTADLVISVNYHLLSDQVKNIYSSYSGEDGVLTRLVDRKVYEQVKNVFGKYNAVTAIQERTRLNLEVQEAIRNSIVGPIFIDSVQIENIDFSGPYEKSIEDRMLAEVEVQKLNQNAEREKVQAKIAVTQAQGQADSLVAKAQAEATAVVLQAKAQAEATRLRGDAEASAIKAKGDALKENPALVALTKAEKWSGVLPTHVLPNDTVPFLDAN